MKKNTFLSLLMMGAALGAMGQTLVPKLGTSLSSSSLEMEQSRQFGRNPEVDPMVGIAGGVAIDFPLGDKLSLQPEIWYVQKGFKIADSDADGDWSFTRTDKVRLGFLEVPVLLKYNFKMGLTRMYLAMGPSASYALGGTYRAKETNEYADFPEGNYTMRINEKVSFEEIPGDYEGYYFERVNNRFQLGAHIGGGVLMFQKVWLDIRYNRGFTEIYEPLDRAWTPRENARLHSLQMTVGIPINLF
jgi:hypothetical protein